MFSFFTLCIEEWHGECVTNMILMPAEQCILGFMIRMALRTDIVGMDKWERGKREKGEEKCCTNI